MTLTKTIKVDKIEIVGEFKAVQVRTATVVSEDGTELSRSYQRHVIQAGDDYSSEDAEVQAVCAAEHTDEVVAAYQEHIANQEAE
jgi:hypothetical protein